MNKSKHPIGYILYEGESLLNGEPIIAIVSCVHNPSGNDKTGDMVQVTILPRDYHPLDAIEQGHDASVCGDCPFRQGICYVNIGQAISPIYRTYKAGKYTPLNEVALETIKGSAKPVRFGNWGDPAAVPPEYLKKLMFGRNYTGYTHQWSHPGLDHEFLSAHFHASVHTPELREDAKSRGYSTYRTFYMEDPKDVELAKTLLLPGESLCPNYLNKFKKCKGCRLCNGNRKSDIANPAHGVSFKIKNFQKLVDAGQLIVV